MTRKRWTEEEIEYLAKTYPNKNIKKSIIANELNRTESSIVTKAKRLKILRQKERKVRPWTTKELIELKECRTLPNDELAEMLGRTTSAIASKRYQMRYTSFWSKEEIEYLEKAYKNPKISRAKMSYELNRSERAISHMASKLQNKLDKRRNWTEEEIEYLKRAYPHTPTKEMSKHLNRPVKRIIAQASHFGVKKEIRGYAKRWTNEELEFIKMYYKTVSNDELGKALGRTAKQVGNKANKLGLLKDKELWCKSEENYKRMRDFRTKCFAKKY